ncbi:TolB family protein [Chitinophaga sp. 22536]|uniref:TolB family protein n=1 Tax=unclassified Chitinophaga TaxID=2619133 RepID=UPI003F8364B3
MKMQPPLYHSFLALLLLCCSCSKKNDNPGPDNGGANRNYGAGVIYYDWANDGILKFKLQNGTISVQRQHTSGDNGWDISLDGTKMLQSIDNPDDYDSEIYMLMNVADGTVVSKFVRQSGYASHTHPLLSPDMQLIAVPPTFDDGLIVLDTKGKILYNLATYQGKKIEGNVNWMPDKTLVFSIGNNLYRTNSTFTQATLVKTFSFSEWGYLSVSRDGSKMALAASNHIWMMNADGSNLVQVTSSDNVEIMPLFSPDGKYLLVGTNYRATGPYSHIWNMAVIPADGRRYNVNEGADGNVVPLVKQGGDSPETCDEEMCWR